MFVSDESISHARKLNLHYCGLPTIIQQKNGNNQKYLRFPVIEARHVTVDGDSARVKTKMKPSHVAIYFRRNQPFSSWEFLTQEFIVDSWYDAWRDIFE